LGVDTDLAPLPLHRSFKQIPYVQLASDLSNIHRLPLVGGRRVVGDDIYFAVAGKVGDDVLGDSIGEAPCGLIAANVVEREHSNSGFGLQDGLRWSQPPSASPDGYESSDHRERQ